jgi:hypothetical protein
MSNQKMTTKSNKILTRKEQLRKQQSTLEREQRLVPIIYTEMRNIESITGLKFRIAPFVCRDDVEHQGEELFYQIESTTTRSKGSESFTTLAVHLTIAELYSFVRGYKLAVKR